MFVNLYIIVKRLDMVTANLCPLPDSYGSVKHDCRHGLYIRWQVAHKEYDFGAVIGTFASLTYNAAVKFRVQYVAGFSDDVHGYSYFLTVQPRVFDPTSADPSSDTESKLIQVLQIYRRHTVSYPNVTTLRTGLCYHKSVFCL